MESLGRKRNLLFGVTSPNNLGYVSAAISLSMLGWKARFVSGYSGAVEKCLAALRGEVDVVPLLWDFLIDRVLSGELRPLVSISARPAEIHSAFEDVAALDGPGGLVERLAPRRAGDLAALVRSMEAGRTLVAPPGLEPGVAQCLRRAMCRILFSPGLEQAAATRRTYLQPACAEDALAALRNLEADVRRLAELTPAAIARVEG